MLVKLLIAALVTLWATVYLGSAVDVTITTYGTDVVFNGETLKGNDNGSPMTFVFSTKHMSKVIKDGNHTVNYGDEDVAYAGPNATEVFPDGEVNPEHVVYIVKFLDGPIVILFKAHTDSGYALSGMNMPPWGHDYYQTAEKLYKDYLKAL